MPGIFLSDKQKPRFLASSHYGSKLYQAACVDQQFINEVSTAVYPGRESFNHRPEFCHIVRYKAILTIIPLTCHSPRKLNRTCRETSKTKALEKRYPDLCRDVDDVLASNACNILFVSDSLEGWNRTRVGAFEEKIFKYMKANVALLKIFIKEPYCTEIIQEVKFPL